MQSIEIEELKNRLSNSAPTIVYQTVPVPVATPEKPVETVVPQPAPAPVEVAMEPLVLVIPPESIPEPAPTPLEPSEPEEEVVKLLPPEPAHVELEPFVEELDSDDLEIRLTSTIATTSSLGGAVQQEQATVICAVPRDIGTDDLVFELRKAVADQFSIPLGRSALVLDGEVVMLGLDVDQRFSAQTAQKQAAARSLTFQISSGKTITGKCPESSCPSSLTCLLCRCAAGRDRRDTCRREIESRVEEVLQPTPRSHSEDVQTGGFEIQEGDEAILE